LLIADHLLWLRALFTCAQRFAGAFGHGLWEEFDQALLNGGWVCISIGGTALVFVKAVRRFAQRPGGRVSWPCRLRVFAGAGAVYLVAAAVVRHFTAHRQRAAFCCNCRASEQRRIAPATSIFLLMGGFYVLFNYVGFAWRPQLFNPSSRIVVAVYGASAGILVPE
jgi:hypothetical protein